MLYTAFPYHTSTMPEEYLLHPLSCPPNHKVLLSALLPHLSPFDPFVGEHYYYKINAFIRRTSSSSLIWHIVYASFFSRVSLLQLNSMHNNNNPIIILVITTITRKHYNVCCGSTRTLAIVEEENDGEMMFENVYVPYNC